MKRKVSSEIKETQNLLSNLLFKKPKDLVEKLTLDTPAEAVDLDLQPAWHDDDDDGFDSKIIPNYYKKELYKETIKRKYEVLIGTPNWAKLDRKFEKEDEHDAILRTVGHLEKTKSDSLQKDFLLVSRFPKIELPQGSKIIKCLNFHPKSSVALVGSGYGHISLFSIGGDTNDVLHSFKLHNFKPSTSHFSPDGSLAYISSKTSHDYCVYDLVKAEPTLVALPHAVKRPYLFVLSPDGKYIATAEGFDEVFLISTASKELVRVLKHNEEVESVIFNHESNKLFTYSKLGQVCIWDLNTYRVIKKFYDEGCVTASCLAISACGRLLATGSGEGIVNIYETSELNKAEVIPLKTIQNLKTKITDLCFNSTTEILSIVSSFYPDAVRLVHIPSYHVYGNFPLQNLGTLEHVRFSPNSGFIAISTNRGCVYLHRLKHYNNY